jgi:predicted nucleic acid-binding protein
MDLADALQSGSVYLDANVFIYNTEGYPAYAAILKQISDRMEAGDLHAVTSELTLAEVLVKPIADGDDALVQTYLDTLETSEGLLVAPVSRAILIQAAGIRARNDSLRLADAIHVATAQATACRTVVTNDKSWKGIPGLHVLLLSDAVTP